MVHQFRKEFLQVKEKVNSSKLLLRTLLSAISGPSGRPCHQRCQYQP